MEFLKIQIHQPFIWTHRQDKLEQFPVDFNKFYPTFKFMHKTSRKYVTFYILHVKILHIFLDTDVKFLNGQIITDLHINGTDIE